MQYRLGLYEKSMPNTLSWQQKLRTAKRCGFDFVELSIDETDDKLARLSMPHSERLELVGLMQQEEIRFETLCLSGHRKFPFGSEDSAVRAKSLAIMEEAIRLACDLGIRIIQLAGYDEYYNPSNEQTKEFFGQTLQQAVEMASCYGIILAFETMETPFMDTVQKAIAWVEQIHSPYLQIYPDCGNLTNAAKLYDEDVVNDLRQGRGHITAAHLKETLPGRYREVPFGTGHVNFQRIISELLEMGVHRFVAECWYVGQEEWENDIMFANGFLRNFFK